MYHEARWTLEKLKNLLDLITPLVYIRHKALGSFRYREMKGPLDPPLVTPDVDDSSWPEINPTDYWGFWMTDFMLRTTFYVPGDWDQSLPVALYLPLGEAGDFSHPEALAYIDGQPYAACDRHHQEILLRPDWADGNDHLLALHGWTGLGGAVEGDFFTKLYMRQCQIVHIHQPTRDFVTLARVALETAANLDAKHPARHGLLNALNEAFLALDTREPLSEAFYATVESATALLRSGIAGGGAPLDALIHATGHAHLDVAWLWTLGETRRKAERTFHNVIRYMEQFPEYHFSQSQPGLYEFIRQDQPELFENIKQRVAEGRWEPLGGMWVEADCNLSGAESLARQFLLGRTFFRQHFGHDAEAPVLWLPDVFGYAWALPQLIKQAGLDYFMTIKIGWSQFNRLPYDTFLWQGLDGTQILTHFSTVKEVGSSYASTYNSMANPTEALGTWDNFQQKELNRDLLMAYGFGDGGGGPTREMLENIAVMGDFPGLPRVKNSSVREFFESIAPLKDSPMMPVWNGELYLEYHRGTYTTQARVKRDNRKSEFMLHDAEFLAAFACQLAANQPAAGGGYRYPLDAFQTAWQTVCLNQFHDIIPGSSIGPVYEESEVQYAQLAEDITRVRDAALDEISRHIDGDILLVNPTSFHQRGLVFISGDVSRRLHRESQPLPAQPADSGLWVDAGLLEPYSVTALKTSLNVAPQAAEKTNTSNSGLENDFLSVTFSPSGDITRIFDKTARREVLPEGALANQLQAFEDRPMNFDAWDIDIYYDDKMWLAEPAHSIQMVASGPLCQTIEIRRVLQNSQIIQRISLAHDSPRLDFDTTVHWNERHTLLKVAFPVDVLSPQATYEIQWGNVQRPTHKNTSWDWARFETCAHKWVDLSEGDYGVALLNDCKYGHDIHDNVIRLTLLRSPTLPDPMADFGEHHLVYSLLPHSGGWDKDVQREAYLLNDPVIVYQIGNHQPETATDGLEALPSMVSASPSNVVIETIKVAENGDGIILRLYESHRKRGPARIRMGFELEAAWVTNLLEENGIPLSVDEDSITLDLKPYQIVTLRLRGK